MGADVRVSVGLFPGEDLSSKHMKMPITVIALMFCATNVSAQTSAPRDCTGPQGFDFHASQPACKQWLIDGITASSSKLEAAKKTCLTFPTDSRRESAATVKCMSALEAIPVSNDGSFLEALNRCSKIENGLFGLVFRNGGGYEYQPQAAQMARASVYICMKEVF